MTIRYQVVAELCHNKRVATDLGGNGCSHVRREGDALRALRRQLTVLERQRLRQLGRTLSLAVEATCRNFDPGEREADVAGHLAHRLIREGVVPVDLRVASDGRLARFRQPTFKAFPILERATIAVTGRRHGLCASVTRSVSFGAVDAEFREQQALATMVDATCIFFSRPGEVVSEVFRRAKRIYEKFGHPHEWTLDYQGSLIGYSPREVLLRPDSNLVLESNMALSWSPSVGAARTEDTVVVDSRGYEVVTAHARLAGDRGRRQRLHHPSSRAFSNASHATSQVLPEPSLRSFPAPMPLRPGHRLRLLRPSVFKRTFPGPRTKYNKRNDPKGFPFGGRI